MALATIDETGLHLPDYPTVLEDVKARFRGIYGDDLYLGPDSQDGQLCAVFALALHDAYTLAGSVYNAYSPATAQGTGLSRMVKINGLRRKPSGRSTVDLRLVGQAGTVIRGGMAGDAAGKRWLLPDEVAIPQSGEITVTATAEESGDIRAAAGDIVKILTPARGWQSVGNPAAALPGAAVETDAELRRRQAISTALPSLTVFEGTLGAVASIPGVTRSRGYENDGGVPDADGIPGHSICMVVEGGDTAAIAEAIAAKKGPGAGDVRHDRGARARQVRRPQRHQVLTPGGDARVRHRHHQAFPRLPFHHRGKHQEERGGTHQRPEHRGRRVAFAPVLARERGQRRLLRHRVHHARDVAGRAVRRKRGRRLQRRGVLLGGSRQAGGAAMSGYLGLVTSEHRNRPRFMATVAAVTDPLCGLQELLETMRAAFDVDSAVGGQLDRTGEWIGRSRHLRLELDDVYFEWGREAVGWARGSWKGLYDPETGMVRLPDETYRLLLKAKIGANRWDGTVPGAYEVWESAFADTGSLILMQDNQDMSVVIGLAGTPLDAVMRNLLLQGYLPLKPEGVRVAWYAVAPERGPLLGWNCETGGLSGWGKGIWPVRLEPLP